MISLSDRLLRCPRHRQPSFRVSFCTPGVFGQGATQSAPAIPSRRWLFRNALVVFTIVRQVRALYITPHFRRRGRRGRCNFAQGSELRRVTPRRLNNRNPPGSAATLGSQPCCAAAPELIGTAPRAPRKDGSLAATARSGEPFDFLRSCAWVYDRPSESMRRAALSVAP